MNDAIGVQISDGRNDSRQNGSSFSLAEKLLPNNLVQQFAALKKDPFLHFLLIQIVRKSSQASALSAAIFSLQAENLTFLAGNLA